MICYLGLGSNLGNKEENLLKAIVNIAEKIGVFSAISSMYETDPWGFHSDNLFLNQVVCIDTSLSPEEILKESQNIEKTMGRKKKTATHFEDRIIDIDILLYENFTVEAKKLTLPHPHLHERLFVLRGLNEIAPDVIHPTLNKSFSELYAEQLRHCAIS
jgi:2-amino-4-hydroxy-6-hydroxymethyldihydropteridine pyrophosphokinase